MTSVNRLSRPLARRTVLAASMLVLVTADLLLTAPAKADPVVGRPAPDFSVTDTNGTPRSLAGLKGKIVVLEWTNADCPFTQKHYNSANMQSLQREATGAGVVWLTVNSSAPGHDGYVDAGKANDLTVSRKAAPSGVILDPTGRIGQAYHAKTTPHMYIIAADGTLVYMGGIDSIASTNQADVPKATPYFRNALQAVLKGQPVPLAETRAYGCSVKYAS
ncbi:MAG: redoxin domain-containing protein [Acetobacteraceae bacterium]